MYSVANKNNLYFIISIVIFLLLKLGYKFSDITTLGFLLKPTNKFVEILMNSNSVFIKTIGHYHSSLNIVIDKSCSGFNFWILSFVMISFLLLKHLNTHFLKIISIPISMVYAYVVTIFVNTSRIFVSIIIQQQTNNLVKGQQHIIHETVGVITNLSFLILIYYFTKKLTLKHLHHEKLA
ncbi:exosortase K [Aquimarina sp. MAR_2010_214]|uniref:exosortase K n=1 Tax=Aquimarina sp. MAR_2010_214 TaxID=1250026 RepID=UPI000C702F38|nr:exosortase K [Aquimarina sp. MAR_2010_214]PKV49847.1 exosortase K [Aquimarina sp. MAR_2010_214]